MYIYMRFQNGLSKALTLSYDDGQIYDETLIKILDTYGIKATFNLNSGKYVDKDIDLTGRMSLEQAKKLYSNSGHEVAMHTLTHPFLEKLPMPVAVNEILQDRKNLEEIFGGIVRGMAYPYGTYNDEIIDALKKLNIAYARTTVSTKDFRLPNDWLKLTATCHHNDPMLSQLTDKFIETNPSVHWNHDPLLFYIWGHSYEFNNDNNWNVIEEFAQKIGNREDIWYATNIEIYNYVEAYKRLEFSVNGESVYNPSCNTVWFEVNGKLISVLPGETVKCN